VVDGYLALVVAILVGCTPEVAFGRLYSKNPNSVHHPITPDELADMQTLKRSGATYREIGEMYGLDKETVHGRLRRYSNRSA